MAQQLGMFGQAILSGLLESPGGASQPGVGLLELPAMREGASHFLLEPGDASRGSPRAFQSLPGRPAGPFQIEPLLEFHPVTTPSPRMGMTCRASTALRKSRHWSSVMHEWFIVGRSPFRSNINLSLGLPNCDDEDGLAPAVYM